MQSRISHIVAIASGKGGGWQVNRGDESGDGPAPSGQSGGPLGRGYLWTQSEAHAGGRGRGYARTNR